METVSNTLEQLHATITERCTNQLRREIPLYSRLSVPEVSKRVVNALNAVLQSVREENLDVYRNYMQELSYKRSQSGEPLASIQESLRVLNDEIITVLRADESIKADVLLDAVDMLHRITETGIIGLYAGYEQAQLEVIESQQSALEELSTPIIPIHEGVLVLPMVGAIDSRRAGQIMEGLLEGISAHSADVVILDITGVPLIDTGVANYLLQAARAARLLGSTVVLVGIGAEIAQTMVQLGIDLTGIVTRANLQSGIEYALGLQGLAIKPI